MKLVCLIKYISESDRSASGTGQSAPDDGTTRFTINPDDACALAFALGLKKERPDITLELLTVSTKAVRPLVEDAVRLGVDHATVIQDRETMGNDALTTVGLLSRYLSEAEADCILTGSQSHDGGSGCVPPMLAELLGLPQISFASSLELPEGEKGLARFELADERWVTDYEAELPAMVGFTAMGGHKLPYIRLKDKRRSVGDQVRLMEPTDAALAGAHGWQPERHTRQVETRDLPPRTRQRSVVSVDPNGIETVVSFLKEKHFI
ncbi:electron transfer flavoprotein beta subunit [Cohaesibacter sp. ES.047]|uniref:electron transfer flavoprotein subunit beta/FixA family protein n=1 Tax=Cohaesibacter sp. ES.047 TaxID=1798205 RepID=UPI000BB7672E|nr:hypothetical protein [Cohaesibacter sp. ES.047]SNY92384.1 electron transfer flavoprotein beta subunit [Cohaesibacter sp. ES.047]